MAYRCGRCGQLKPPDEFFRRRAGSRADGPQAWCKTCAREVDRLDYARRASLGQCPCGEPRVPGASKCVACREIARRYNRKRQAQRKAAGRCISCGGEKPPEYAECEACAAKREARRKVGHRLSLNDRAALFAKQDGRCALCNEPLGGFVRRVHAVVDHDHVTKRVRGLVHHQCNVRVRDLTIPLAEQILAYLQRHAVMNTR